MVGLEHGHRLLFFVLLHNMHHEQIGEICRFLSLGQHARSTSFTTINLSRSQDLFDDEGCQKHTCSPRCDAVLCDTQHIPKSNKRRRTPFFISLIKPKRAKAKTKTTKNRKPKTENKNQKQKPKTKTKWAIIT